MRNFPPCSAGFNRFEASIAPPEVAPAPITVWISSINKTASGWLSNSSTTALRRSSKSPRYRVPASNAPISSEKIVVLAKTCGVSPETTLRAKPSAMAVLPTPGSPTKSGLFLRRRHRTCTQRSTSWLRPISGSISPSPALAFKSTQYLASADSFFSSSFTFSGALVSSSNSGEPETGRASPKLGSLATPCAMKLTAS